MRWNYVGWSIVWSRWDWLIGWWLIFFGRGCVAIKIEYMIMENRLWWYGEDISCQIREVMELEITGKIRKGQLRTFWEECIKKYLDQYGLRREDPYDQEKWWEEIKAKIGNPCHQNNSIKTNIVDFVTNKLLFSELLFNKSSLNHLNKISEASSKDLITSSILSVPTYGVLLLA